MFLSPRLDLRARVVLASKVSFFFRLWRLWFMHGDNKEEFTVNLNFVSQQCFIDIQISCHFLVLLVCHFRDTYPHLPIPLHLTGSDSCEIFFSKIGGMQGMERSYDFHEVVNTANTINRMSEIEYSKTELKFNKVHNKMSNIWEKLHPLADGESPCNLGDYSLICSPQLLVSALEEGLLEAQRVLRSLNMAPSIQARPAIKQWFYKPWLVEKTDPRHMAFVPRTRIVRGEDGDAEVLRDSIMTDSSAQEGEIARLLHLEEDIEHDGLDNLSVLQEEARDALTSIMNDEEVQVNPCNVPSIVVPYVECSGHRIFKSTLVTRLNGNPFLSKDRLTRVRNSIYYNNSDDILNASSSSNSCLLGVGSDCGVFFVQRSSIGISSTVKAAVQRSQKGKKKNPVNKGQPCRIMNGVDEGSWWVGRVQKIRRRFGSKWGACRQAVDLLDRPGSIQKKGISAPSVMVLLTRYSKQSGHYKFKYDLSDWKWIDLDSVISTVSLSFNSTTKVYTVLEDDAKCLNDFVSKKSP